MDLPSWWPYALTQIVLWGAVQWFITRLLDQWRIRWLEQRVEQLEKRLEERTLRLEQRLWEHRYDRVS